MSPSFVRSWKSVWCISIDATSQGQSIDERGEQYTVGVSKDFQRIDETWSQGGRYFTCWWS